MTTKRSSTRTIILSLVGAALFGLCVLWASVHVQIWVFTWWDKVTATQEYKERNLATRVQNPASQNLQRPSGNWENSPQLSEAMKMIIAEVEKNEALYNQLSGIEVICSYDQIMERFYDFHRNKGTNQELDLYYEEYKKWKSTKEENEVREKEEPIDPEKFSIAIDYLSRESHIVSQGRKYKRLEKRAKMHKNLGLYEPKFQSVEDLKFEENLKSFKQIAPLKLWGATSYDDIASYTGFTQGPGTFSREVVEEGDNQAYDIFRELNLYEGGSAVLKRIQDTSVVDGVFPREFTEAVYIGEEELAGENLKVVQLNYYPTKGFKKRYSVRKLYLATDKNYLPVRIEDYTPDGKELLRLREVTNLKEIKPAIWFPLEIVDTGKMGQKLDKDLVNPYTVMNGVESPFLHRVSPSELAEQYKNSQGSSFFKSVRKYEIVQVEPDYDQSFFSTVPGIPESELSFLKVAEQFVKHFQADEEEELLELTHPQYFDQKYLNTLNDSPVKSDTLELYNYEMKKFPHDLIGQEYDIAAGVIFKAYNRKFTKNTTGNISLLLRKDDQGNWRVDSCGSNYRYGYQELLRLRMEHLYQPPVVSTPSRKPAIAEKEKTEKAGSNSE